MIIGTPASAADAIIRPGLQHPGGARVPAAGGRPQLIQQAPVNLYARVQCAQDDGGGSIESSMLVARGPGRAQHPPTAPSETDVDRISKEQRRFDSQDLTHTEIKVSLHVLFNRRGTPRLEFLDFCAAGKAKSGRPYGKNILSTSMPHPPVYEQRPRTTA